MSVLTGADVVDDVFGGTLTEIGVTNMPAGGSPANQNVDFLPGVIRTRGGLQVKQSYSSVPGGPWGVRYSKSFGVIPELQTTLALLWNNSTGAGNLLAGNSVVSPVYGYGKTAPWNPTLVDSGFAGPLAKSVTQFSREYIAVSQGRYGWDIPRQWDGTKLRRVSQCGPGATGTVSNFLPAAATIASSGTGSSVNLAASPTGAVRGTPVSYTGSYYIPDFGWVSWNVNYDTTITFTTTTPHGALAGQQIAIAGAGDFNGTYVVSQVLSATQLVVMFTSTALGETGGSGTLTPQPNTVQRLNGTVTVNTAAPHSFRQGWSVVISGVPDVAVGGGISSVSQVNGVATCVTASAHGLVPGASVDITGTTNYNSPSGQPYIVVSVPTPTTFTFVFLPNVPAESAGTVSSVFNGTFTIQTIPTATSFTYASAGPNLGETPMSGTATIIGNVTSGAHQLAVSFITDTGYITRPSPPVTIYAIGNELLQIQDLPIGPSNVVGRLIHATLFIEPPATTGDFFSIRGPNISAGNNFQINDNASTNIAIDFTDTALASSESTDYLFDLIELGPCASFTSYAGRIFAIGELATVSDLENLSFNGGWSLGSGTGGSDVPLGWTNDPTSGAGGSRIAGGGVLGDAYQINAASGKGMITQPAYADSFGDAIFSVKTMYGIRATALSAAGFNGINVDFYSPSQGVLATVSLSGFGPSYMTVMGSMNVALPATIPVDTLLRIYSTSTTGTISLARIEIYPTSTPINTTVVRASRFQDPESFDGVLGLLQPMYFNGESVRAMFVIRDSLYFVCDRSMYVTKDTGGEPATWTVDPVSSSVGCSGPNALAIGEDWAVKANRYGLYMYIGREPQKISHEIQTLWNQINWAAGGKVWVAVDPNERKVYVGAPVNGATEVNQIFLMSYETLDTSDEIAGYGTLRFSAYSGRRLVLEQGRKWTIWNFQNQSGAPINIPSGSFVEQSDGTAVLLLGGGADSNLYFVDPTNRGNDNGAAVDSYYTTHFFPTYEEEQSLQGEDGRRLRSHLHAFNFLRHNAIGNGMMKVHLYNGTLTASNGNPKLIGQFPLTASRFNGDDETDPKDITAERWAMKFETSGIGSWFQIERSVHVVEQGTDALIRGATPA